MKKIFEFLLWVIVIFFIIWLSKDTSMGFTEWLGTAVKEIVDDFNKGFNQ